MEIRHHKDLDVWKESMNLVHLIYKVTRLFPKEELFVLSSQMRRAVVSIPSNIAEGAARNSTKEFIQFLGISLGSLAELDTQYEIAIGQGYTTQNESISSQINKVRSYLWGLKRSLSANI